jgi:hypothetical protein
MKLSEIVKNPQSSLCYMERLVNNGSKSSFTFTNTVSDLTNPLYVSEFALTQGTIDGAQIRRWGEIPNLLLRGKDENAVFVHPDLKLLCPNMRISDTHFQVHPTASKRTVLLKESSYYIKLAYPRLLGRMVRTIENENVLSSIDITKILFATYKEAPQTFAFFPEKGGEILKHESGEIGYVVRDSVPVGYNTNKIAFAIPAFSLFGKDHGFSASTDEPLLFQLLNIKEDKLNYLFANIIFPLLDCYFYYLLRVGVQFELHSQNFLIGFDKNFDVASFIIRDLESADKDLTIMKLIGKDFSLKSYPYKCINASQYNYKIKHSFMYDYKLGEYFIDEVLLLASTITNTSIENLRGRVRAYVREAYGKYIDDLFPSDGKWYKFSDTELIDRSTEVRPYIAVSSPHFR